MAGVITKSPFRSDYGFDSPGFSVDENGNIIANSILLQTGGGNNTDTETLADFIVTGNAGENSTQFVFENIDGETPILNLRRGTSYIFDLDLGNLSFSIFTESQLSSYNEGLAHSDGGTGINAQGKNSGLLSFSVGITAPDLLFYGDSSAGVFGRINIQDPDGRFGEISVTDNTEATSSDTGALKVSGGVGIGGDLVVGKSFSLDGLGVPNFYSGNNLEIEAVNEIIFKIDDSTLGSISDSGSTIPVVNTTINNTIIGDISPAVATFSEGDVTNVDVTKTTSITNKSYVDTTALAFSITFGL